MSVNNNIIIIDKQEWEWENTFGNYLKNYKNIICIYEGVYESS